MLLFFNFNELPRTGEFMHKLMREENNKDVVNNRVELWVETELKLYNQCAFFYIQTYSPLHSYLLCLKSLCIIKSTLLTSCMFRLIIVAFNSRILIFITNGKINNSFTFNFWIINNTLFRANDNEAAAHNSREFTNSTEHSHTEYL